MLSLLLPLAAVAAINYKLYLVAILLVLALGWLRFHHTSKNDFYSSVKHGKTIASGIGLGYIGIAIYAMVGGSKALPLFITAFNALSRITFIADITIMLTNGRMKLV